MKIAIISDIHDNLPNLERCLDWCDEHNIRTAVCCGDVTNKETLKVIAEFFSGGIFLVRGNMEIYDENEVGKYGTIRYLGRFGTTEIEGKIIGICHEPDYIKKILELGKTIDIIFYGHTHRPWTSCAKAMAVKTDTVTYKNTDHGFIKTFNPGTIAGTFSRPTFATWDTATGEVKLVIIEMI